MLNVACKFSNKGQVTCLARGSVRGTGKGDGQGRVVLVDGERTPIEELLEHLVGQCPEYHVERGFVCRDRRGPVLEHGLCLEEPEL